MRKPKVLALPVLGALLLLVWAEGVALGAGSRAAEFTLTNLKGQEVALTDLLADGPVLLDFWATWCKPCIKAFPGLQELFDKYRECGFRVVAISLDGPRSVSRVGSLVRSSGHTFEVLLDKQGRVAKKYHVAALPRTVLVSPGGEITYGHTGYNPGQHEKLEEAIRLLLPEDCTAQADGEHEEADAD